MPVFTCSGYRAKDLWLVDGSPEFAFFPGGVVQTVPNPLPIRLRVGTMAYGETHIRTKHGHWVTKFSTNVPELVYQKRGQSGAIYSTEEDGKLKISLRFQPSSLLVLHLIGDHFSVTSLYMHPTRLDGRPLGKYRGRQVQGTQPEPDQSEETAATI